MGKCLPSVISKISVTDVTDVTLLESPNSFNTQLHLDLLHVHVGNSLFQKWVKLGLFLLIYL